MMPVSKLLQENQKFEIQTYKKPKDEKKLYETHVAFSGSPLKHPFDDSKVVLIVDPFSSNTLYYEFYIRDLAYAEELANVVNIDGKTVVMVRIWVKKGCVGVRCTPFIVEDTRQK